jgi:hypothetical protein
MDPGHKGPKEEVVGNEILHIKGRGRLDCERLARMQWKVPTTQKKGTKPKEPTEAGTSKKTSSPAENTRKVAEHVTKLQEAAQPTKIPERKRQYQGQSQRRWREG